MKHSALKRRRDSKTQAQTRLDEYRRRRRFGHTPEPRPLGHGRKRAEAPRFVVQLHHAQRRHFDFRLEVGGSLRSWAVPRGPSLDAEQKRLAVEVEDHPLAYADFEGRIPAGNYGAGSVAIWDQGHWQPDKDPALGLAEGHLGFTLYGKRLRGRWSLIRTGIARQGKDKPQWLLIKARDSWVRRGDVADNRALSATGYSDAVPAPAAGTAKLPAPGDLQLTRLSASAPDGQQWLHEVKFDGYRLLIQRDGETVHLLSRNGTDWTSRLGHIADAVRALRCQSAVLDAELIALDAHGRSDFGKLQQLMGRDGDPLRTLAMAFDLLAIDHRDQRALPQLQRKRELARLVNGNAAPLRLSEFVVGHGPLTFKTACGQELEGIISKRGDAPYQAGRSGAWLKIKCVASDEFAVVGYTAGHGAREALGSLLLAQPGKSGWHYAGRVGSGISDELLAALPARFKPRRKPVTLDRTPTRAELRGAQPIWVTPTVIIEAQYRGITHDGLLRQASLKTIRNDKTMADLQPHDDRDVRPAALRDTHHPAPALTHPQRPIFATPSISKQQLADFYTRVSDWLLPGIRNRPISLMRCPDGVDGVCFFQRHLTSGFPRAVRETRIAGPRGRGMKVIYIDDVDGLIGLVQMGVVEIHAWGSTLNNIEHPDQLVLDLDPGSGVPWARVTAAARALRARLAAVGLQSFVRTSGGKGLHLLVPLTPKADWHTTKAFTRAIAQAFATEQPRRYTDVAGEKNREGRIFIDYLRNSRGASSVASYSLRARSDAPAATPLTWSELHRVRGAGQYGYANLLKRLTHLRKDPWQGHLQLRQTLPSGGLPTADKTSGDSDGR